MSHNEGQKPGSGNQSPRGSGPSSPPPQRDRAMSYDPRTLDLLNTINRAREQGQGGSGPSSPQGHNNNPDQGEPVAKVDPALRKRPRSEGQDGQQVDIWRNRGGASPSDASHRSKRQRLLARRASSDHISRFLVEELGNRSPQVANLINIVTGLIADLNINSNSVSSSRPDSASSASTGSSRPDSRTTGTAGSNRNLDRPQRPRRGFFSYQNILDRIITDADTLHELMANIVVDNFYGQLLLDIIPDPNNPGAVLYLRPDRHAPRPGDERHPALQDTATSALRAPPPAPNSSNDSSGNWAFGRARDNDSGNRPGRQDGENINPRQIGRVVSDSGGSNFSTSSNSNVGPGSSQSHTPPDSGDTSPASPDSASSDSSIRPQNQSTSTSTSSSRPDSATRDSANSAERSGNYADFSNSSSRPDSATRDTAGSHDAESGGHSNSSSSRPDSATRDSANSSEGTGSHGNNSSSSSSRPDSASRGSANSGDRSSGRGNYGPDSAANNAVGSHEESGNLSHNRPQNAASRGHSNNSRPSSPSPPDARNEGGNSQNAASRGHSNNSRPSSASQAGARNEGGHSQNTSDYYLQPQSPQGGHGNAPATPTRTTDYYLGDPPNVRPVAGNFAALLDPNRAASAPGGPFDINEFRNEVLSNSYHEMDERVNSPERLEQALDGIWNMAFPQGESSGSSEFGSSIQRVGLFSSSDSSVKNYNNNNRQQPVASRSNTNSSSSRAASDDRRTEPSNSNSSVKASIGSNSTGYMSNDSNGMDLPSPGNHGSNNQGNPPLGAAPWSQGPSPIPRPGQYVDSNSAPSGGSQPRAPPNLSFAASQTRSRVRSIGSGGMPPGGRPGARSRSAEGRLTSAASGPSRRPISPGEVESRRKLAAEISREDPQRTARALVNVVRNSPDRAVQAINYAVDRLAEELALLRIVQLEQGRANSQASVHPESHLKFEQDASASDGEGMPPLEWDSDLDLDAIPGAAPPPEWVLKFDQEASAGAAPPPEWVLKFDQEASAGAAPAPPPAGPARPLEWNLKFDQEASAGAAPAPHPAGPARPPAAPAPPPEWNLKFDQEASAGAAPSPEQNLKFDQERSSGSRRSILNRQHVP
ncbi:hypothetical protein R1sor_025476 [Riccia sorocarpa]|uniref:Uncharacterized protein n=1 Tax=Riccia sorocarpa TaxID=122646 RepID=A0ABD3G8R3_9MARC